MTKSKIYLILSLTILLSSYFTQVRSFGLSTQIITEYDEVYSDRGTGADMDLSVWKPRNPSGWYNLGYIFTNDRNPPGVGTVVVQDNTPDMQMLAEPTGWSFNWYDRGSGGDVDGSIWTPQCPAGYYALGSVAIHIPNGAQVTNAHFPDIRCVRCSLLEASSLGDVRWSDRGSGADMDITVYSVQDSPFCFAGSAPRVVKLAKQLDRSLMTPFIDEKAASLSKFVVGDFNGDGKDDFISQEQGSEWANLFLRTTNEDKFNKIILPRRFDLSADTSELIAGDFNGDGRDDFIRLKAGSVTATIFLARTDGTSFTDIIFDGDGMDLSSVNVFVRDFDGDGRDDIFRQEKGAYDHDALYTAQIHFSNGDGTFRRFELPEEYRLNYRYAHIYVGDFNGDGKADFLRIGAEFYGTNTGTLFLNSGRGSDDTINFVEIPFPAEFLKLEDSNTVYIGDFNGDGKDDFIRQVDQPYQSQVEDPQDTVSVFISLLNKDVAAISGQEDITSLFQQVSLSDDLIQELKANENVAFYVGDFNGDKKDDLIRQPTNLRWDSGIANIFLSSIGDDNNGTAFRKLPDVRLRGDFTRLTIGDFNGDGRSDLLKQEKGTWGDAKFSLPTLFLALDDSTVTVPFQKIYYREELDANLIKDTESVKADLGKKLEYDLVNLANKMGYETMLWENSYNIVKDNGDIVLQANTGVCDGVSIKLTNWTFAFGDILWGEALRTEQQIIQTDTGVLDNTRSDQASQQNIQWSREFTTDIQKYDLSTFSWNVGGGISTTAEVSAGFTSITTTYEVNFSIGESSQTGTISATGETRTLSSSATATVPARSSQRYQIKVFGIKTNFDTSVVQLDARFAVEFAGPLRADNYFNNNPTNPQDTKNVVFRLGSSSNPFYRALSDQIQRPQGKQWDWDALIDEHPESYEWIRTLTDRSTYSTSQYFNLEAIQGTEIQIELLPVTN